MLENLLLVVIAIYFCPALFMSKTVIGTISGILVLAIGLFATFQIIKTIRIFFGNVKRG